MKRQDNILARYTEFYQTIRNPLFWSIVLDPDFLIPNIEVENAAMNTLMFIPAHRQQLVVIACGVHNRLQLDLTVGGLVLAVFVNDLLQVVTIPG